MSVPEVVVVGEPLVELSAEEPLETATSLALSFSGDALNAAAASAAAGVATGLVTRVGDDELGGRLLRYAETLGVTTTDIRRGGGPTGAYLVGADPEGRRDFAYLRHGSAASSMRPEDLDGTAVEQARVLLVSGIAMAASRSLAETVVEAARRVSGCGGAVVYDPNFRRRLTTPEAAQQHLARLLPSLSVVLPSAPADTVALVDTDDPVTAVSRLRELGAGHVVVTCGAEGTWLALTGEDAVQVPPARAREQRDATGAGDVFAGTLAAGLTRGPLDEALVGRASQAAARSLAGRGGTGHLAPTPDSAGA